MYLGKILKILVISIVLFFILFPIFVLVKYSISDRESIITGGKYPEPFWPFSVDLEIFNILFGRKDFLLAGLASLEIASLTVLFCLVLGAPTAFALVRFKIPGIGVILFFLLSVRLFPDISAVIPVAEQLLRKPFSHLPSVVLVALAHTLLALPYTIYIAQGVFETIPRDLEEQAQVLGAKRSYAFLRILIPLALPGLAAAAIYTFFLSWNEFIFAYFLMFKETTVSLPVYLLRILSWAPQKNFITAISLMISVPVIIFTFLVQKYMRTGLTAGAVKQ
ncbi:MAG: carbohydrate ABC transporter permease [Candidatus Zixiibacteriota bacterium]